MAGIFTQQPARGTWQRQNGCANPRVGVGTTGFSGTVNGTGATFTVTRTASAQAPYPSGTRTVNACRVTCTAPGTGATLVGCFHQAAGSSLASPGQTMTASAYVRALGVSGSVTVNFYLDWLDSGGAILSTVVGTSQTGAALGTWYRLSATGTAPAGTQRVRVSTRATGTIAVNSILDTTAILVENSATLGSYFDGAFPDGDLDAYGWGLDGYTLPDNNFSTYWTAGATDQVAPVFGPTTPTEYARESNSIVRGLLEDPSQVFVTLRKAGLRSGEWSMLFDTAAAAKRAVDMLAGDQLFYFDGDGDASQVVKRFITPAGQQVRMHAVENTPNSTGAEWLYEVVCPWQEVSP